MKTLNNFVCLFFETKMEKMSQADWNSSLGQVKSKTWTKWEGQEPNVLVRWTSGSRRCSR